MDENNKTKSIPVPQIKKCKSDNDSLLSWKNSRMTDIIKQLNNSKSTEELFEKIPSLKKSITCENVQTCQKNMVKN